MKTKGGGARKGSGFEREVAKALSLWWTEGSRDDVFWRSSNSGGRATARRKRGQRTAGQHGDIAATDPVGEPFLKVVTIELKAGYGRGSWDPLTLIETDHPPKGHPLLAFWKEAREEAGAAIAEDGVRRFPLLIFRRMRGTPMIMMSMMAIAGRGVSVMPRSVTFRTRCLGGLIILPLKYFIAESRPRFWVQGV